MASTRIFYKMCRNFAKSADFLKYDEIWMYKTHVCISVVYGAPTWPKTKFKH